MCQSKGIGMRIYDGFNVWRIASAHTAHYGNVSAFDIVLKQIDLVALQPSTDNPSFPNLSEAITSTPHK